MNPDKDAETPDPTRYTKPKTLHMELEEYDPFDHETLANEPC